MEARAKYNFESSAEDELSFKQGDLLKIRNKQESDWYQGELNGRIGLVPTNYIQMEPHDWYKPGFTRRDAEDFLAGKHQFDGVFLVRDCQADKDQFSLSVLQGTQPQHFKILSNPNGTYYLWPDKTFPSINKLIEYHRSVSVSRDSSQKILLRDKKDSPTDLFEALFDFSQSSPDELSFSKGDRVKVIDKSDPNWWVGQIVSSRSNAPGTQGLLPHNYVKKV